MLLAETAKAAQASLERKVTKLKDELETKSKALSEVRTQALGSSRELITSGSLVQATDSRWLASTPRALAAQPARRVCGSD